MRIRPATSCAASAGGPGWAGQGRNLKSRGLGGLSPESLVKYLQFSTLGYPFEKIFPKKFDTPGFVCYIPCSFQIGENHEKATQEELEATGFIY